MKRFVLISMLALFLIGTVQAQVRAFLSPYNLPTDTVVNAATAFVSIHNPGAKESTTVWAILDKQSGTVGGVITLQVSVDGVTWKAMNTTGTQTAMATVAAVGDADNTFHWWFPGNPFNYYRLSYTGVTGPMQATIAGKLLSR